MYSLINEPFCRHERSRLPGFKIDKISYEIVKSVLIYSSWKINLPIKKMHGVSLKFLRKYKVNSAGSTLTK
jgi:hypothetical protein